MNIPIFCLNLERAKERRELIQREWIDKLGFDITFWKAFDKINLTEQDKQYNNTLFHTIHHPSLFSIGEIACIKSFVSLYEYLINKKYLEVIIMEDDITPLITDKKELFDYINKGKIEFPSAEIMLLFEPNPKDNPVIMAKAEYFSSCISPPWGNQLLYVNFEGMKKILSALKQINIVASHPQQLIAKIPNKVIMSNKGLCSHDWMGTTYKSYIQQSSKNYIP